MGLWGTIKGWLNIGGVKVKLEGVPQTLPKPSGEVSGKVHLVTKDAKHVLKMIYQLVEEKTTGRGDDKETEELVLGECVVADEFDLSPGEEKSFDFSFPYDLPNRLADQKGALGALGKMGSFASGEKFAYCVVAKCDVKGTALDPSAKSTVKLV